MTDSEKEIVRHFALRAASRAARNAFAGEQAAAEAREDAEQAAIVRRMQALDAEKPA